jgi:hypothetical protein
LDDPISWQIKKVKALRSRMLDFNIQSLTAPILHAMMFLMFVGYTVTGLIVNDVVTHGTESEIEFVGKTVNFIPIMVVGILGITVFDKLVLIFMYYIKTVNQAVFNAINKADHKLWRKTGKDSPVSNALLRFGYWFEKQPRFVKMAILYGLPIMFIIKHVLGLLF